MIYFKVILLGGLFILAACSIEEDTERQECFFKASLTKANYSAENSELHRVMGNEIAYAYFEGEIAYFPFETGFAFYFGGTCEQAAVWKNKIAERFKVEDITKNIYWRDYKILHEEKDIIPFEDPEDQ
jgi:hypothetical protein